MKKNWKFFALVCVFLTALNIVACGQVKEDEIVKIEEYAINQQENDMQEVEDTDLEATSDELLDSLMAQ